MLIIVFKPIPVVSYVKLILKLICSLLLLLLSSFFFVFYFISYLKSPFFSSIFNAMTAESCKKKIPVLQCKSLPAVEMRH